MCTDLAQLWTSRRLVHLYGICFKFLSHLCEGSVCVEEPQLRLVLALVPIWNGNELMHGYQKCVQEINMVVITLYSMYPGALDWM